MEYTISFCISKGATMKPQSSALRRSLTRIVIALILLLICAGFILFRRMHPQVKEAMYDITVIPPTCTDSGYSLYTNKENGTTYTDDLLPATGHSFGSWEEDASDPLVLRKTRFCALCGAEETEYEYARLTIPVIALEGSLEGIGKKSEVSVSMSFTGPDQEFTSFATLKYQGHSSLSYEKKNYTLKLFRDGGRTQKNKLTFSHWNPEHKYILKANYIDPSQSRNLIGANLWADVVASRDRIPAELKNLSNYGAVDGFPVALWLNGDFQGLYTMTLHKDDDLFGMEDGYEHAILIANTATADEAFFRNTAAFQEDSPWEVEYCGTGDSRWAEDKLNELIRFVLDSDDGTFRENLHRYLDVDSAIDYLLSMYALGLTHHGADEMMLVCYSRNDPWIASLYDMETAFGLSADGTACLEPEAFLPEETFGSWNSNTGSLLWDRLLQNFFPEIQARYQVLRQRVFDPDAMCLRVTDYLCQIDPALFEADHSIFPQPNPQINHQEQIVQYILRRIELLDGILLPQTGV